MGRDKNKSKNHEDNRLNFCGNIVALRKKYHLTQAEMAEVLGISVKSLRSLEKGKIPPRLNCSILFNIYKSFDIFPSDMFSPPKD